MSRPSDYFDNSVMCLGIDVLGLPADEVIELLSTQTRIVIEDGGYSVVAPDLLLSLWRPTLPEDYEDDEDEDGRYFRAALVAAPGYYDGPS